MSHFGVLVPAESEAHLQDVMLPYHEYECTGIEMYLEFFESDDEVQHGWNNDTITRYRKPGENELYERYDERFRNPNDDGPFAGIGIGSNTHLDPEELGYEQVEILVREWYNGEIDRYAEEYHGYERNPKTGKFGRWTNPNAEWDWYQIGGRWTGYLSPYLKNGSGVYEPEKDPDNIETCWLCSGTGTRKDPIVLPKHPEGVECNGCNGSGVRVKWPTEWKHTEADIPRAGDVDWNGARLAELEENMRKFDAFYTKLAEIKYGDIIQENVEKHMIAYNREGEDTYGGIVRKMFPDPEDYVCFAQAIDETSVFGQFGHNVDDIRQFRLPRDEYEQKFGAPALFFAYIDLEGNWHERADMGFWAMTGPADDEYHQKFWDFVTSLDPEQQLFVVDCHI